MTATLLLEKQTDQNPRWTNTRFFDRRLPVVQSKNVRLLLYAKAFMWFHKIADFRQAESALLYEKTPSKQTRSQHRQIIEILIDEGMELVRQIHANGGLIKQQNGFSIQDIQSSIAELKNTVTQRHGNMTKAKKEEILGDIFNAAQ